MGFIKDSLSVKVFLLVVIAFVAMVSLVVVMQRHFNEVNTRYDKKVKELDSTFGNLVGAQVRLNQTIEELEVTGLREDSVKEKYNELKSERDKLQQERTNLLRDVEEKNNKISSLELQLAVKDDEIGGLKDKVSGLNSRIDCFENGQTSC